MTFALDYRRYALRLRVPLRTSQGLWPVRDGVILRLRDGEGRSGYGEIAPIPWFGTETAEEAEAVVRQLGPEPTDDQIARVPMEHGCVRCALAAALESLPGGPRSVVAAGTHGEQKRRHVNTSHVQSRETALPVAALLPAGRAALAEIDARLEMGFRVFKWKVGVADTSDELALMDDLLGRMPSGARLRLDANGAWDRRRAERWLERCADRPIDHVEQPIAPDFRGAEDLLLGLANDYPTPIGLDESLVKQGDVERWLRAGWPGVYVLKPSLLADASGAMDALAKSKSKVVFSSALETGVGARAALRHAFSWRGETRALGFGVWPLFQDDGFDGPFAAPFLRWSDIEGIDPEAIWKRLS